MNSGCGILIKVLVLQCLFLFCVAQNYDFFYYVQQWGPSLCNRKQICCYPPNGQPATNFTIAGLYPSESDGRLLMNCNKADFCEEKISNLKKRLRISWPTLTCPSNDGSKFWSSVFKTYGTCALDEFSQRQYFEAALKLKDKINVLKALADRGIYPGGTYYLSDVKKAIKDGTGYEAAVECNKDKLKVDQIYKVLHCVDASASEFIECPTIANRTKSCSLGTVHFPTYSENQGGVMSQLISQVTKAVLG